MVYFFLPVSSAHQNLPKIFELLMYTQIFFAKFPISPVADWLEWETSNLKVPGSILGLGQHNIFFYVFFFAANNNIYDINHYITILAYDNFHLNSLFPPLSLFLIHCELLIPYEFSFFFHQKSLFMRQSIVSISAPTDQRSTTLTITPSLP